MTLLARTRVALSGWSGGPGVNTFVWSAGTLGNISATAVDQAHTELAGLYNSLDGYMVNGLVWEIEPEVAVFESSTGKIVGVELQTDELWNGTATATGTSLSRSEMVYTRFLTGQWVNGRQLCGGFWLGPVASTCFESDGTIAPNIITEIQDQFAAITTGVGPRLAVYHRPTTKGGDDGLYHDVTQVITRNTPGTLRSRKT